MFGGHFAVAFAAKRVTPRVSLAMLFAAAQLADLLWPVLVALGIEQVAIEPGITRVTPLNFLVAFLAIAYAGNLVSPPPPSVTAIAMGGIIGGAMLLLWAWRVDRHRTTT